MDEGFKPGHLPPFEWELVQFYKVSRLTVREAINRLVGQRLVIKKQGRGPLLRSRVRLAISAQTPKRKPRAGRETMSQHNSHNLQQQKGGRQ